MRALAFAAILGMGWLAPLQLHAFLDPQLGQPAPAFAVRGSAGQMVTLADYDDRVVVIEWLDPRCDAGMQHYRDGRLPALQKEAAERGVVWLTVLSARPDTASHLDNAAAQALAAEHKMRVTELLVDDTGTMARAYGIKQLPAFFVLGVDGRMTFQGGLGDAAATGTEAQQPEAAAGGLEALTQAIQATLGNESPAVSSTAVEGCELTL